MKKPIEGLAGAYSDIYPTPVLTTKQYDVATVLHI